MIIPISIVVLSFGLVFVWNRLKHLSDRVARLEAIIGQSELKD